MSAERLCGIRRGTKGRSHTGRALLKGLAREGRKAALPPSRHSCLLLLCRLSRGSEHCCQSCSTGTRLQAVGASAAEQGRSSKL